MEQFPTCCINEGGVCAACLPAPRALRKHALCLGSEACLLRPSLPLPARDRGCALFSFFFFSVLDLFFFFFCPFLSPPFLPHCSSQRSRSGSSWCPALAAFPRLLAFRGNQWLLILLWTWVFCADGHGPSRPRPFRRAVPFSWASLQTAEICGGPVSTCLSHLVFNLWKSG